MVLLDRGSTFLRPDFLYTDKKDSDLTFFGRMSVPRSLILACSLALDRTDPHLPIRAQVTGPMYTYGHVWRDETLQWKCSVEHGRWRKVIWLAPWTADRSLPKNFRSIVEQVVYSWRNCAFFARSIKILRKCEPTDVKSTLMDWTVNWYREYNIAIGSMYFTVIRYLCDAIEASYGIWYGNYWIVGVYHKLTRILGYGLITSIIWYKVLEIWRNR